MEGLRRTFSLCGILIFAVYSLGQAVDTSPAPTPTPPSSITDILFPPATPPKPPPSEPSPKPSQEVTPEKASPEPAAPRPKKKKEEEDVSADTANPAGLRPFGYDFFLQANQAGTGDVKKGLSVPNSYLLDSGDELDIVITSQSGRETKEAGTVNADGNLYVPGLGLINVTGMTLRDLERQITQRLSERFGRPLAAIVSMIRVHAIQVYVTGAAMRPGSYILSGLATPIDALYAAGGPSLTGSMRNIQIVRRNTVVASIDFYQYLLKGRITPLAMQSEDVLLISSRGQVVGIQGEVLRPALYEVTENENLQNLIQLAGGVLPTSYAARVRIDHIVEGEKRMIEEANLGPKITTPLSAGDTVTVYSILPEVTNAVSIKGGVKRPGFYGFSPGMKVSDLLHMTQGFAVPIYTKKADILRRNPDRTQKIISFSLAKVLSQQEDPLLQPGDEVSIYPISDVTYQEKKVAVRGAIANPATYNRVDQMRVGDLVAMAGGLTPEALSTAQLARSEDGRIKIIPVDLVEAVEHPESAANILLADRDTLYVSSKTGYKRWAGSITVKGEVAFPGDYPIIQNQDTLFQLIKRAGGLTPQAYPFGAVFVRKLDLIAEKEQLDVAKQIQDYVDLIAQQLNLLEYAKLASPNTTSNFGLQKQQTGASQNNQTVAQANTNLPITTISGVPPFTPAPLPRTPQAILNSGRIPIDLEKLLKKPELADLPLKDGDTIYIPQKPRTVVVAGAVFSPSALLYMGGKVSEYLDRAGGIALNGDSSHLLIVRANGETIHASYSTHVGLGDIILVPTKGLSLQKSGWDKISDVLRVVTELAVFKAIF